MPKDAMFQTQLAELRFRPLTGMTRLLIRHYLEDLVVIRKRARKGCHEMMIINISFGALLEHGRTFIH